MQFLLFLTALFAGFTGVFSGGRAVEPSEVGQALAAAAAISDISVRPVRRAETRAFAEAAPRAPARVRAVRPGVPALLPERAPVDERRLE